LNPPMASLAMVSIEPERSTMQMISVAFFMSQRGFVRLRLGTQTRILGDLKYTENWDYRPRFEEEDIEPQVRSSASG